MRSMVLAPPSGRRVALTGACSSVGAGLLDLLEEDARVRRIAVVDRARPRAGLHKTRHYRLDLLAAGAAERFAEILVAERIDTVVHLALSCIPSRDARALDERGTETVLAAAASAPPLSLLAWSQTLLYGADAGGPALLDERRPLRAPADDAFFAGKLAAERALARFAAARAEIAVTVLRTAPLLGRTAESFLTRYLSHKPAITLLGFDPVWQLLHERDAAAAFKLAFDRTEPGIFNVVGDGVVPLSAMIRAACRRALPIPHPLARGTLARMWSRNMSPWSPGFLPFLRYACLADGARAAERLGFRAACSSEEALADFAVRRRP